jgi:hypothetical protein
VGKEDAGEAKTPLGLATDRGFSWPLGKNLLFCTEKATAESNCMFVSADIALPLQDGEWPPAFHSLARGMPFRQDSFCQGLDTPGKSAGKCFPGEQEHFLPQEGPEGR